MQDMELKSAASEYLDAMRTVRIVKSATWLLVWVAIAVQLTCFILVQFAGLIDEPDPTVALARQSSAATAPATAAASRPEAIRLHDLVLARERSLAWLLPVTKFIAPAACLVLWVSLLVGLLVSLVGRLGGTAGLCSALFWSLILLAVLLPWQDVFPGMAGVGVLYDLPELKSAVRAVSADWEGGRYASGALIVHYIRFLAYPVIALLVWMLVGLKFAKGLKAVNRATSVPAIAEGPTSAN